MLVMRYTWVKVKNRRGFVIMCRCEGWYLFGFLLLYKRQVEYPAEM